MPQGGGGAQAVGHFWRNAALSIGTGLTQIAWDADSAAQTSYNLARSSGRVQSGVTGPVFGNVVLRMNGVLSLQSIRLVVTRSPGTTRELVVLDERRLAGGLLADFSLAWGLGGFDVVEGDELDFQAAPAGLGVALGLTTGSELNTHVYLGVG